MRCQGVLSYVSDILLKINGGGAWGSYLEFTWHKWKRLYENEKIEGSRLTHFMTELHGPEC